MSNRSDNFNRADSTSTLNPPSDGLGNWTVSGTWGISSNRAYPVSSGNIIATLDSGSGDGDVQVTVAAGGGSSCRLIARWTDDNNHIIGYIASFSVGIYKKVAGAVTLISSNYGGAVANGDVMKLSCTGTTLELYQNGTLRASASSNVNQTATRHGFGIDNISTIRFDDFSIVVPTPPNGTTIADGDWSSASTWASGYIPGAGDNDLHIKNAVTVSDSRTVGSSPGNANATKAITIDSSGRLTIQNGGTLKVRGDVECISTQSAPLTVQGGGIWEFDSSAASSPSTVKYTFRGNGATTSFLTFSGSANGGDSVGKVLQTTGGTHAIVRSNSGGGNGYFTNNGLDKLNVTTSYAEITRIGDATNKAFTLNASAGSSHTYDHTTFDACGDIYYEGSVAAAASLNVTFCRWTNSVGTSNFRFLAASLSGGATRKIEDSSFDKPVNFNEGVFAPQRCMLGADAATNDAGASADIAGNAYWKDDVGSGAFILRGNCTDCYFFAGGTDNPHFPIVRDAGSAKTLLRCVFEYGGQLATDAGNTPYGGGAWTMQNCIWLPAAAGNLGDGAGAATGATAAQPWNLYHCSLYSPTYTGGILLGDGTPEAADYPNVKSNLFWAEAAKTAVAVTGISAGLTTANCVTPAGCVYNGFVNANATRYQGNYPTTQPGANDVLTTGSPATAMVDPYRNVATWAVTRGSASVTYANKVADAKAYLSADPTLIPDLLSHVRGGMAPRNTSLKDAGHDGVTIGAVEGVWTTLGATYYYRHLAGGSA